jgi:shikimate kinase
LLASDSIKIKIVDVIYTQIITWSESENGGTTSVRILLTGVGCVGKTTVGKILSELLDVPFFDLDEEIEDFFGISVEQLQSKFLTIHSYRDEAAKALVHLLKRPDSQHSVIALPPGGLMGGYLRAIKKSFGVTVALSDSPENILKRIVFYDIDSKLIEKCLTSSEKRYYLSEIKKDITYFRKTYGRANIRVDISDLDPLQAALCVKQALEIFDTQGAE